MRFIITTCVAVILCLILLPHVLKSRQTLLETAGLAATDVSLSTDLRQAIQASLASSTPRPLPEMEATVRSRLPLPRDPFAFHPLVRSQAPPPPSPPEAEPPPLPPTEMLRLKATAIDRYGVLAFINDQVLTVGQAIAGYTVVHIDAGQVELSGNGARVSLYLDDNSKP
jgi:hypothetical protein